MQGYAPVTTAQLLAPCQELLFKFEVWDGAAWQDLTELGGSGGENYLKSISISLGGAGMSTEPMAGTWSASLRNADGIFHPKHPTSLYKNLLRAGREVRIKVGGLYGVTEYYWQRLVGFMDAPRFNHGDKTVDLSGTDYSKLLTDTMLRDSQEVTESGSVSASGSDAWDLINGPTHWGTYTDLDSVESLKVAGAELYDEADALEIGAHEANNMTNWVGENGSATSAADATGGSTWVARIQKDADTADDCRRGGAYNDNIASLTAGKEYLCSFKYKRVTATTTSRLSLGIYKTGTDTYFGGVSDLGSSTWTTVSFYFTATETVAAKAKFIVSGRVLDDAEFRVDQFSFKEITSHYNQRYILPDYCNGPYFVTLDGEAIWQGMDEGSGWHYDESGRIFWLDDTIIVATGAANLRVYFYTTQVVENVLADLLAGVGLYANRALALADIDYDATGVEIPRVWFDAGAPVMSAVAKLCERVDYRFWFGYDGRPHFQPAPIADAVDFSFTDTKQLKDLSEFQDRANLRNRIIIEGIQTAMYPISREDKTNTRLKSEAYDTASIAAYLEHSSSIQNHLFQQQNEMDLMAAHLLHHFKDPAWCSDLQLFANPVPLELGDVIEWPLELEPVDIDPGSLSGSGSGSLSLVMMGIIRDIKIDDSKTNYKVEVADVLESWSYFLSGTLSASPSASASASVSASPVQVVEYITSSENFTFPSGFYGDVDIECWSAGGKGADDQGASNGGGGAGGGGYSIATETCEAGITYYAQVGNKNNRSQTYRNSYFKDSDSGVTLCKSIGGPDAVGTSGAAGSGTTGAVGDTKYGGGAGDGSAGDLGGGGGGGAGTTGAGNGASGQTPGDAKDTLGGPGGWGGNAEENGSNPDDDYGGGGGGAGSSEGSKTGAIGKNGLVRLTYWI